MSTLASVIVIDLTANRPAASIPGRLFFASDTGAKYRDNGAAWDVLTQAQTIAAVTHKFLTAFDAATGLFAAAQPAASDVSGLAASATIDTTDAANISSGTLPAARLPNPSAATLGGVESAAAIAHQWIDSISAAGVPHLSQPAESDLSLTDIATNDVSTARHGLAPKAPNDATRYLDGTGAYSTPAGAAGAAVTHSAGALTADQPVFGAGGADTKAGTKTGNTDQVVSQSGAATAGRVLLYDANGNAVAGSIQGNTATVQMASGPATGGRPLIYDANGNAIAGAPLAQTKASAPHQFLISFDASTGLFAAAEPAEADLSVTDITTNNVSTAAHGLAPKAPNDATKFLDGTGAYSIPAGGLPTLTTKGDLLAFSSVLARQPVGANGTCLQADSTQATGIGWALQPCDVIFSYPGAPPNATVLQLICFRFAVAMSGNFAGSTGHCGGNPASTAVYAVYKNASPIGTVTISTSGGFAFSTTAGAAQSFVAGDTLSILTPAADATLSSVTMTFAGTR